ALHDRLLVPAGVERVEVELVDRDRLPKPERVDHSVAEAGYRAVVCDGDHVVGFEPREVRAPVLRPRLHATVEPTRERAVRARHLPRRSVREPRVRHLHLASVLEELAEDAVVVADAVAGPRDAEGGHRIEEAGRESAEAPVAEAGVFLDLEERIEIVAE